MIFASQKRKKKRREIRWNWYFTWSGHNVTDFLSLYQLIVAYQNMLEDGKNSGLGPQKNVTNWHNQFLNFKEKGTTMFECQLHLLCNRTAPNVVNLYSNCTTIYAAFYLCYILLSMVVEIDPFQHAYNFLVTEIHYIDAMSTVPAVY